jgi:hypothetical protein
MPRKAWGAPVLGFLLLLATCLEGSMADAGDRFLTTLATAVATAAGFYHPPYFVRLPDTATTFGSDAPTTSSTLIALTSFAPETFHILALDQIRTGQEQA